MPLIPIEFVISKMLSRLALLQQFRQLTHPQRMKVLKELAELSKQLPAESVSDDES